MTILTCDVTETGAAASAVALGLTDSVSGLGYGKSNVLLAVLTSLLSTAAAISLVSASRGPDVIEHGTATSLTTQQTQGVNIVLEQALATSVLQSFKENTALSTGAATSAVALSRDASLLSVGVALSPVTVNGPMTSTVLERAVGTTYAVPATEITLLSQGAAQSVVVVSSVRSFIGLSQGAGQSSIALDADTDFTALSTGVAVSLANSQLVAQNSVLELAAAADALLVPQPNGVWVMNTENTAMSRWTGLPVSSIAVIGGLTLGLGEAGLYKLSGHTDDGLLIKGSVLSGKTTLGQDHLKSLSDIIVSYVCAGVMQIKISTFGTKTSTYTYPLESRVAKSPRANRVTPGKGLRSRYFQFEFTSASGAAFDVDSVTTDVAVHTRRI